MTNYLTARRALLPLVLLLPLGFGACRVPLPELEDSLQDASAGQTAVNAPDAAPSSPDLTPTVEADQPDLIVSGLEPTPAIDGGAQVDPEGCGGQRPDVSQIVGADGLAIADDGTIYFTQEADVAGGENSVGRLRPGAAPERRWLPIPGGTGLGGLAIDDGRRRLYVLVAGTRTIHHVDISVPGAAAGALATLATTVERPNEILVGPDGQLYYTAEGERQVFRLSPAGAKSQVTATPTHASLPPAGLAFAADDTLLVGTAGAGPILRLTLAGGVEQSRRNHGHLYTWGNSLTVDSRGRLYVAHSSKTEGRVLMMVEDESAAIQVAGGVSFGGLAFGRGALDCHDLYVAAPSGPLLRLTTGVPGR